LRPYVIPILYSVGKDGRLLERAWQMEFYQAATQVLPPDIFISADVGGQMDMWISLWMMAGVGQSNYYGMVQMRLATRVTLNQTPKYSGDYHWINVYCQEDWKSVIIKDKDERVE
ncbi:3290_t:CDS:2, partial [Paraglomus occultum]